MNKIVRKEQFSEKVFLLEVEAPLIARSRKAGHFVIVRVDEMGERLPLTIADADINRGTITLVIQKVGLSSTKICDLEVGEYILDIVGPLGNATHIENYGTVLCASGGVGTAPLLPIVKALKAAGNRVLSVIAGRSADLVILEDEIRQHSDEVIVMTDDGTRGEKGVVTVGMEKFIQQEKIDKAFAIGPAIMMKFACLTTQKYGIPTDVSLNTIMVDGTGMCGACRLTIGGKTKFVCIDGPEFDGALVDWDEMFKRMSTFKREEQTEMEHITEHLHEHVRPHDEEGCRALQPAADETEGEAESADSLTDRNAPWREALRKSMKPKERTLIPRVVMPELDPEYRATTRLEEVNKGLTEEQALLEAKRCLDCPKPQCVEGCPVNINIPSFIKNIERGEFLKASQVLKMTSALPAVCGRVCPQEKQCESKCIHLKMNEPAVAIGYLERFAADYERESGAAVLPHCEPANGKKIAVVGSGPSGLSFAGDMIKRGYEVHVFEALHEIGGVLKYGIPEFRLPNRIVDVEIDNLRKLGVQFHTSFAFVGQRMTVKCHLVNLVRQIPGNRCNFVRVSRILKHIQTSVNQPCSFNIMTIGMQINQCIHLCVKKDFLSVKLGIIYAISKLIQYPMETLFGRLPAGHPVKFCICLKYMKQGVHGFIRNNTIFRGCIISDFLKYPVESLHVSNFVFTLGLYHIKQTLRQFQSFLIS